VTGPLLQVSAEDHRAPYAHDLTGLHPTDPGAPGHDRVREPGVRARATRAANIADAVPVSQLTWTSGRQIAADAPERHRHA
jgi:hypothetical protein